MRNEHAMMIKLQRNLIHKVVIFKVATFKIHTGEKKRS
jgi:hypothetical protein